MFNFKFQLTITMKKNVILFLAIFLTGSTYSQQVKIANSEVKGIASSNVAGQEYELQIMLPSKYTTTKKYPVLYLMDSQWDFPLVTSLYGQQYFDGFIPEMIIVGVTWGGKNPNPDSLRARDYTPTNEKRLPQSGGADKYLSFMKNELFPFIEKNYSANANDRTLMGCSLGGLFTLYTLFTHPEMFQRYVATSPAFMWDNEVLYQYEKKYAANKSNPPAKLFMCVGGVERSVSGFQKLTKYLNDQHYSSLQIESRVLENTGHSGTKGEGFARGLQYVLERPSIKLSAEILNNLTGNYQSENGNNIQIKKEENTLVIYFSSNNKYQLLAAGENDFYSKAEFLKIHFKINNTDGTGFQLDRYGNTQFFKKNKSE